MTSHSLRLRELTTPELLRIYEERMRKDFPANELKKPEMLEDLMDKGLYLPCEALAGEEEAGYAHFLLGPPGRDLCLLDYYAIREDLRGAGYGSGLLPLMNRRFSDQKLLLCEVEDPFLAKDEEEARAMHRRMAFYLRAGWRDTEF